MPFTPWQARSASPVPSLSTGPGSPIPTISSPYGTAPLPSPYAGGTTVNGTVGAANSYLNGVAGIPQDVENQVKGDASKWASTMLPIFGSVAGAGILASLLGSAGSPGGDPSTSYPAVDGS